MPSGGVEVARAYVTITPKTDGTSSQVIDSIVNPMTQSVGEAGEKAGGIFNSGLGGVLAKFAVPAAIVGALAGIGKAGFSAFEEVQAGTNNVIKATGATGEAAKQLDAVYKNVASNVVGDFGDIGAAVGDLNTRLGLTGTELQSASEEMMKYAKVTGQDATKATKDVASMMRNTGIPTEELGTTLGKLTVAGQKAGIDVSSLAKNTTKYNAVMKQMGFTTDEQIAMMAKFEQSGADTSSILNAMKKGVAGWAKDGKDAKTEFANFVKGVQDGSVTAGDAVKIFGSKGGLSMYEAAQKGQLSFDDMFGAISEASSENLDTVYEDTLTASEKMGLAWQNVKIGTAELFAPMATGISNVLSNTVIPTIQTAVGQIGGLMATAGTYYDTYIAPIVDVIVSTLDPIVKQVASDIGAAVIEVGSVIGTVFKTVMPAILTIVKTVFPVMGALIKGQMTAIKMAIVPVWRAIKPIVLTVVSGIATAINTAIPKAASLVKTAMKTIKTAIQSLSPLVAKVKSIFKSIKTAMENPVKTAKDAIQKAIDKIKSIINGAKLQLPKFKLPHFNINGGKLPWGIGGKGSKPSISVSWYAKGGIFDDASLIGIGEKGPEAVVPLDPFWKRMDDLEKARASTYNNQITVNVNGAEDPEAWASKFARQLRMEVRMA